jgi:ERF superfamily
MTTDTTARAAGLYRKLATIAGAIESVAKDGQNKDQKYKYATPASVFAALKPLLAEQQLAIIPHLVESIERETGRKAASGAAFLITAVKMHYHLVDGETGEVAVVPWEAQAGTYGDDKGLAKAQTIALRTFLIQLFQIPAVDEDLDPDARDARPAASASYQPQQPARRAAVVPAGAADPIDQRPRLIDRIHTLTAQLDPHIEIELKKPLDQMTEAELIEHGQRLKQAKDRLKTQGVTFDDKPAAVAA